MKKQYEVHFEFFGKKVKAKVSARNKAEAQQAIRNKIKFYKTIEIDDGFGEARKMMEDLFK